MLYQPGDSPVPGYQLVKRLGQGGLGEVWQAVAPGGTMAALKFISLSDHQGLKELRALRLYKRLKHPNLVAINAFWLKGDDGAFVNDQGPSATVTAARANELIIATSLADQSLHERLQECLRAGYPGIPLEELLTYLGDVARALDYLNQPAHDFGGGPVAIHHGGLTPHNILLVSGAAQISDLGLARVFTDTRSTVLGSADYLAPELLGQNQASPTSDQYSLALIYLHLRAGVYPFAGCKNPMAAFQVRVNGHVDLARLPEVEQQVLRRALDPIPGQRFPTSGQFVETLRRVYHPASSRSGSGGRRADAGGLPQVGAQLVPGYTLRRQLGRGGYGEVWEATSPGGKPVALKIIGNLDAPTGKQEFRALELIKGLQHNHLLEIHAYWLLDRDGEIIPDHLRDQPGAPTAQTLVICTSLASKNLMQRLQECQQAGRAGIPVAELLGYLRQAARALDYLNAPQHRLGATLVSIQHRDVKPENLLLVADTVKVGDFGLAKVVEGLSSTIHGDSIGLTFPYAAPEMFDNKVTRWSDQYSLALTYYRLRTGAYPFPAQTSPLELVAIHTQGKLDLSRLPESERQALQRATHVAPDRRYPTCHDLAQALAGAAAPAAPVTQVTLGEITPAALEVPSTDSIGAKTLPTQLLPGTTEPPSRSRRSTRTVRLPAAVRRFPWKSAALVLVAVVATGLLVAQLAGWLTPRKRTAEEHLTDRVESLLRQGQFADAWNAVGEAPVADEVRAEWRGRILDDWEERLDGLWQQGQGDEADRQTRELIACARSEERARRLRGDTLRRLVRQRLEAPPRSPEGFAAVGGWLDDPHFPADAAAAERAQLRQTWLKAIEEQRTAKALDAAEQLCRELLRRGPDGEAQRLLRGILTDRFNAAHAAAAWPQALALLNRHAEELGPDERRELDRRLWAGWYGQAETLANAAQRFKDAADQANDDARRREAREMRLRAAEICWELMKAKPPREIHDRAEALREQCQDLGDKKMRRLLAEALAKLERTPQDAVTQLREITRLPGVEGTAPPLQAALDLGLARAHAQLPRPAWAEVRKALQSRHLNPPPDDADPTLPGLTLALRLLADEAEGKAPPQLLEGWLRLKDNNYLPCIQFERWETGRVEALRQRAVAARLVELTKELARPDTPGETLCAEVVTLGRAITPDDTALPPYRAVAALAEARRLVQVKAPPAESVNNAAVDLADLIGTPGDDPSRRAEVCGALLALAKKNDVAAERAIAAVHRGLAGLKGAEAANLAQWHAGLVEERLAAVTRLAEQGYLGRAEAASRALCLQAVAAARGYQAYGGRPDEPTLAVWEALVRLPDADAVTRSGLAARVREWLRQEKPPRPAELLDGLADLMSDYCAAYLDAEHLELYHRSLTHLAEGQQGPARARLDRLDTAYLAGLENLAEMQWARRALKECRAEVDLAKQWSARPGRKAPLLIEVLDALLSAQPPERGDKPDQWRVVAPRLCHLLRGPKPPYEADLTGALIELATLDDGCYEEARKVLAGRVKALPPEQKAAWEKCEMRAATAGVQDRLKDARRAALQGKVAEARDHLDRARQRADGVASLPASAQLLAQLLDAAHGKDHKKRQEQAERFEVAARQDARGLTRPEREELGAILARLALAYPLSERTDRDTLQSLLSEATATVWVGLARAELMLEKKERKLSSEERKDFAQAPPEAQGYAAYVVACAEADEGDPVKAARLLAGMAAPAERWPALPEHRRKRILGILGEAVTKHRGGNAARPFRKPYKEAAKNAAEVQGWLAPLGAALPDSLKAELALAAAYRAEPDARAAALADTALKGGLDKPTAYWLRLSRARAAKDPAAALDDFAQAWSLVREPAVLDTLDAKELRGELLTPALQVVESARAWDAGQKQQAAALYAARGAVQFDYWFRLGTDPEEFMRGAHDDYRRAVELDPQAGYWVGKVRAQTQLPDPDLDQMDADARKAVKAGGPRHGTALGALAVALRLRGQRSRDAAKLEEAREQYTLALDAIDKATSPRDYARLLAERAGCYMLLANYDRARGKDLLEKACAEAREALKLRPSRPDYAYQTLGNALEDLAWQHGQIALYPEAVEAFTHAYEAEGTEAGYLLDRARCQYRWVAYGQGKADALNVALADLNMVVRDSRNDPRRQALAHDWRGLIYLLQGDTEDVKAAKAEFAEAEKLVRARREERLDATTVEFWRAQVLRIPSLSGDRSDARQREEARQILAAGRLRARAVAGHLKPTADPVLRSDLPLLTKLLMLWSFDPTTAKPLGSKFDKEFYSGWLEDARSVLRVVEGRDNNQGRAELQATAGSVAQSLAAGALLDDGPRKVAMADAVRLLEAAVDPRPGHRIYIPWRYEFANAVNRHLPNVTDPKEWERLRESALKETEAVIAETEKDPAKKELEKKAVTLKRNLQSHPKPG